MIQKLPFTEATVKLQCKPGDNERDENKRQQDGCLLSCAISDQFNTHRHLVLTLHVTGVHTRTAPNSTPMNVEVISVEVTLFPIKFTGRQALRTQI